MERPNYNFDIVRGLWLNNPYCHLMFLGNKLETRTRSTNVRGTVLLCSCKVPYPETTIMRISGPWQTGRIHETMKGNREMNGYALYISNLVDSRPMKPEDEDRAFVKYNPDLFIWEFQDVAPVVPFQLKGKQGWKIMDSETKSRIQLA